MLEFGKTRNRLQGIIWYSLRMLEMGPNMCGLLVFLRWQVDPVPGVVQQTLKVIHIFHVVRLAVVRLLHYLHTKSTRYCYKGILKVACQRPVVHLVAHTLQLLAEDGRRPRSLAIRTDTGADDSLYVAKPCVPLHLEGTVRLVFSCVKMADIDTPPITSTKVFHSVFGEAVESYRY